MEGFDEGDDDATREGHETLAKLSRRGWSSSRQWVFFNPSALLESCIGKHSNFAHILYIIEGVLLHSSEVDLFQAGGVSCCLRV